MIDLTPWQVDFIRKKIHSAKICKQVLGYVDKDEVELNNFADDLDKVYPDSGIDE